MLWSGMQHFYIPADTDVSGAVVEQRYIDILQAVKSSISIPIALKLSPYSSSFIQRQGPV